jgi:hypothetical protein
MKKRPTWRSILAGLLGLFAIYFMAQAGMFILDFTLSLLREGFGSGPQLAFTIVPAVIGILFLMLAFYFGRSAIQVYRVEALAAKTAGEALKWLLILCVLYLASYYLSIRPEVLKFDPSARLPLIPWLSVLATAAVASGLVYSRRMAKESAARETAENAGRTQDAQPTA